MLSLCTLYAAYSWAHSPPLDTNECDTSDELMHRRVVPQQPKSPSPYQTGASEIEVLHTENQMLKKMQRHMEAVMAQGMEMLNLMTHANETAYYKHVVPTFEQLLNAIYGTTSTHALYKGFVNENNVQPSIQKPTPKLRFQVGEMKRLKPPKLILDVGAEDGSRAIALATITSQYSPKPIILCIDSWTTLKALALPLQHVRSTLMDQWIINIMEMNLTERVVPLKALPTAAARLLIQHEFGADWVFLDTPYWDRGMPVIELALYWKLLADGGVMVLPDENAQTFDVHLFEYVTGVRRSNAAWGTHYVKKMNNTDQH